MENLPIEDFDLAIVGAGPVGVAVAAEARAAGGVARGLIPAGTDHAEQLLLLDATSAASPAEPAEHSH
jgi:2-polyprenyl-6-methoxyphenol hydroxylase-like FAD-dependent oxidoreductase